MTTSTLDRTLQPLSTWWDELDLKTKIKNLPMPLQVVVNGLLVTLLFVDMVFFDGLPLIDELLLGWLLYNGVSATFSAVKERRSLPETGKTLDVRGQQASEPVGDDPGPEDYLKMAADKELEALEQAPFPVR